MPVTPLYVRRDVLNAREIIDWAKVQGFKTVTLPEDMHTTITYSKAAVDWESMGDDIYSDANGHLVIPDFDSPRSVVPLGDGGAVVLKFNNSALQVRHNEMLRLGASWDFPSYMPHITLTYDIGDVSLDDVIPWVGRIVLGPEVFSEIEENWSANREEAGDGLYYLQPDGSWKKNGDGRSKGRTREELPEDAICE